MSIDWTPIVNAAVLAAAGIVSASGVVVATYIRSRVKNQNVADALVRAETMGAGIAHDSLTTAVANGAPNWDAAKKVAIAEGVAGVKRELAADVTPTAIAAALSPLLAADPTVPAGAGVKSTNPGA